MTTAALGQEYSDAVIRAEVAATYARQRWTEYPDPQSLCAAAATLLAAGKVIAWFQGRAEWGPRALGQRSILANPCVPDMRTRVNQTIKFREPFRPFAPAVLYEDADKYFELVHLPEEDETSNPYVFMLAICRVRPKWVRRLPAITHTDGTARVQTVRSETNPLFYQLIAEFGRLVSIPVLLNTSFNLRGEPIVNSPDDAIRTFEWSNLDAMVLGNIVILR
jgi:carbamoyltransferase